MHPLARIVIAHIGKVPVEEWLPFLFPVLALFLYGRHWSRRRRQALGRLPAAGEPIDDDTIDLVLSAWARAGHAELGRAHLRLLYPPGPDGATVAELAGRARCDPTTVEHVLEELQELGYLDLEEREPRGERRAWLTPSGYDLVAVTENALLTSLSPRPEKSRRRGARTAPGVPPEVAPPEVNPPEVAAPEGVPTEGAPTEGAPS